MDVEKKPHVVCMPAPWQSHIIAMFKLAKLLHCKGFYVTFVHSEFNYKRIIRSDSGDATFDGLQDFRFETIPDGLETEKEGVTRDVKALAGSIKKTCAAPFSELIARLNGNNKGGSGDSPAVTCIVSDAFASFSLHAAAEHGIPIVFLCTISACSFMGFYQFDELVRRGIVPLKNESDLTNGYLEKTIIDWIPGMNNIRLRDLPSFVRTTDADEAFFNSTKTEVRNASKASAIIINTFEELELPVLSALSSLLSPVPIFPIGPLSLLEKTASTVDVINDVSSSFWKEDDEASLEWLQDKKPESVVYVNFGSITVMSEEQMLEFAWGIVNSNYCFLWAIRPDLVKKKTSNEDEGGGRSSDLLPPELLKKMEKKGFLCSWCNQERVLNHPAIGVFLTHSGWNSTMESISSGVPMICWPFFGDQTTNCHYVCRVWEIGVEITGGEEGGVARREEVERLVKEVMNRRSTSSTTTERLMKKKALEWREKARKATSSGGSSWINLEKVIQKVMSAPKN